MDDELFELLEKIETFLNKRPDNLRVILDTAINTYVKFRTSLQRRENEQGIIMAEIPIGVRRKILKKINQDSFDPWNIKMIKKGIED